MTYQKVVKSR